jgi:hypothetical protein
VLVVQVQAPWLLPSTAENCCGMGFVCACFVLDFVELAGTPETLTYRPHGARANRAFASPIVDLAVTKERFASRSCKGLVEHPFQIPLSVRLGDQRGIQIDIDARGRLYSRKA